MADSIVALISENLRLALHGKTLTYNGASHTTTCDRQRISASILGRYPFIELLGPAVDVLDESNVSTTCALHYLVEFRDHRIDDELISGSDALSFIEVVKNVPADIQKLIMTDPQRGGYAMHTNWGDFGYYVDIDGNQPECVLYQMVSVTTILNSSDPYLLG